MDERAHLVEKLRYQAWSCRQIGSPLYEVLLSAAAEDAESGGPVYRVVEDKAADPDGSAVALRLMAAVHRLVLRGAAPELARFYPSAGGTKAPDGAVGPFLRTVAEHLEELREDGHRPLQTNEVGRCAALVGGFLTVAARFGLPLDLLELGSSAGLNLRWDHYLYEARGETWGDPASPVRLCSYNSEAPPPFHVPAEVVRRRGCDPNPVDPLTDEGRITLLSFVWPDQVGRLRLLRAATEVARRVPVPVERSSASAWLPGALAERAEGAAAVVFHSIVWQYMDEDEQSAVTATIEEAGRSASTDDAPLAWLRMEPAEDQKDVELRLRTWPGGDDVLLARSGYHGTAVRWLEG